MLLRLFSPLIRLALLVALGAGVSAGCQFHSPTLEPGNAPPDGSVPDGDIENMPYMPSNFAGWDGLTASGAIVLECGVSTFDSASGQFSNWCGQPEPVVAMQDNAALLAMASLTVKATDELRIVGNRPVILAVLGNVDVAGTVNASAVGSTAGPTEACAVGELGTRGTDEADSGQGAGGGGGGAFGTAGGTGGTGGTGGGAGGNAGTPGGSETLVPLRGGCPGGQGGAKTGLGAGATLGAGGGGVQISARGAITVTGVIASAGGGGQGGTQQDGAGGGGSGGGILLEGVALIIDGKITANGGAGGEGGSSNSAGPEASGADGARDSATPAVCNDTSGTGGLGGAGAAGLSAAATGSGGSNDGGGGGGGGGVGRIRLNARDACTRNSGNVISPEPTTGGKSC